MIERKQADIHDDVPGDQRRKLAVRVLMDHSRPPNQVWDTQTASSTLITLLPMCACLQVDEVEEVLGRAGHGLTLRVVDHLLLAVQDVGEPLRHLLAITQFYYHNKPG